MSVTTHRYVIYTPGYNENSGGIIALHRLCDLLNKRGFDAVLHPKQPQFSKRKPLSSLANIIVKAILGQFVKRRFKTFRGFSTPVSTVVDTKNDIVVYPEIVIGNPLGADNVVRWLLHKPGFITGDFQFCEGDLFFYYQKHFLDGFDDKHIGGELRAIYVQDIYRKTNTQKRRGTCYIMRKGKGRKIVHDLKDSVLIDGMSHERIAEVFNRTEACISYDLHSMYSRYAAVCGCLSIVVPDPSMDKYQWRHEEDLRWGIAYGFDDIEWAKATQDKVLPALIKAQADSNKKWVDNFVKKCEMHFGSKNFVVSLSDRVGG